MALVQKILPKCDPCGKIWLPDEFLRNGTRNPAFDNPALAKRCGKCKSSQWNKNEVGDRRKRNEKLAPTPAPAAPKPPRKRCKHQLLNCPSCHAEAAA